MRRSAVVGCAALLLAVSSGSASALPSYAQVKAAYVPSESLLVARDGRPLHSRRIDTTVRRFAWTPLHDMSPALLRAVIASEDKNFFEHSGVDWKAAGSAAWSNVWDSAGKKRLRGASTLTMQLVGLIDEDEKRRGRRSVLEKLSQTALALQLDRQWSKRQILETYLNLVAFRGELQGVGAMSRTLFGKWPDGLVEREAALAAALLRAPNAAPRLVSQRACVLLKELERASECEGLDSFATYALGGALRQGTDVAPLAPHLAAKLLTRPGQTVKTSLDADLQGFAAESLRRHLRALVPQNAQDGAVVVLDNATGEVLAWVGSSGELSGAANVDGVTALRQAGSTLKPFLYGLAFQRKTLTPASLIEDAPLALDTGNGLYAPQNYEPDYRGWVSIRSALGGSLNVPAVKTLTRIGPEPLRNTLRQFGFDSLTESGEWYGYSLALGSADISLLMLANAYRALANAGVWTPLRSTPSRLAARFDAPMPCADKGCAGVFAGAGIPLKRTALSAPAAFQISDILADRNARAGTFGLESWLSTPYWSAVKTGTSKDMRDNWCAGYSRRYTVGVWVGNAAGEPMHDVSGISGAAPIWREVLDWLHRGDATLGRPVVVSAPPEPPKGLLRTRVRFDPPVEAAREEWFLPGTEHTVVRVATLRTLGQISYPANGSIIALDPDIPPQRQRLPLRLSSPPEPGWRWRLNGKSLGPVATANTWLPRAGAHELELVSQSGQALDRVRFEVRAMPGRGKPTR